VIVGAPLRTLDGEFELIAATWRRSRGGRGAHTLENRSDASVRHLMLSTKGYARGCRNHELGIVRVLTRLPLVAPEPDEDPADRLMLLFDSSADKQDRPPS
jgi:hypothetical protein